MPVPPGDEDVCQFLYDPTTQAFIGCPTIPHRQVIWKIIFAVPATLPAFNNARVRCESLHFLNILVKLNVNFLLDEFRGESLHFF